MPRQPGRSPYSQMHRRLTARDVLWLVIGLLLGGVILGLVTRPLRLSVSVYPSAPKAPAQTSGSPAKATPADWPAIVAELRSPDETRPRELILLGKLDKDVLNRLAVDIPNWPESRQRDRTLRDVFRRWAAIDPKSAIAQAQTVAMPLGLGAVRSAIRGFVEADPAQATAFLAAPPTGDQGAVLRLTTFRQNQLQEALLNWSEQDPQAAIEFLVRLPPGDLGPRMVANVTAEWARQDPSVALHWASQLGNPALRTDATRGAVSAWTEIDPAAAASYVSSLPLGPSRDMLTGTVARGWVQRDPAAAARWASSQTGTAQGKAIVAVAAQWAQDDAPSAAAWSLQLPAGGARDQAWKSVAAAWGLSNPAAAAEWLGELPAGPGRDSAISGFSEGHGSIDPAQTLTWVQQIGDPGLRDAAMVTTLRTWIGQNPDAAWQWINQTPLPRTVRDQIRSP